MSGIAGIVRFDGAPVSEATLQQVAAAMRARGPDGVHHWRAGSAGLVHLHQQTLPTPLDGVQPIADPSGRVHLVLDGRIDSRGDLRAELGAAGAPSDAELVLQAFLRWGHAAIRRLVGDFALAVWDERHGELVCARDFLGKRPLHYLRHRGELRFASDPQALLADTDVPRRPNLGMVAEHLSGALRSTSETVFEGLQRLPPAHLLIASASGVRTERYWAWDPAAVAAGDEREQITRLRDAIDDAVRARLLAPGPVAAELSGGLDSSLVVSAASSLRADSASVVPLSLVFPGQPEDESQLLAVVADRWGLRSTEISPSPAGAAHYEAQARLHLDLPGPPNLAMHLELFEAARGAGARVLLTGEGGDEWFSGSHLALAEALRGLRLGELRAVLAGDRAAYPGRVSARWLLRYAVAPLLPARAQHALRRRLHGDAPWPPWIRAELARTAGLADRLRPEAVSGPRLAAAQIAGQLDDGGLVRVAELRERAHTAAGLEGRSPLDDRRVVELALGLPERLRRRGGVPKWALREAAAGLVPDQVRLRVAKASFRSYFHRELTTQGGAALFDDLAIEQLGWVSGAELRTAWVEVDSALRAGRGHPLAVPLWAALSTERWVRATL